MERRLVEDHIPFVRSLARKLRDHVPMVEFDDLVGFGMQGLIEAAQRFDDRHGVAFTTFAGPILASGTTTSFTNSTSASPGRYFQIEQLPP